MSEFNREDRYIVIKRSDLTQDDMAVLSDVIHDRTIKTRDCVVVESHWPNYDQTWQTIQQVAEGTYKPAAPDVSALVVALTAALEHWRHAAPKCWYRPKPHWITDAESALAAKAADASVLSEPEFQAAPQPEQAAPDVSGLVEALERISNMDSMSYHSLESAKIVARKTLASWRQSNEEK